MKAKFSELIIRVIFINKQTLSPFITCFSSTNKSVLHTFLLLVSSSWSLPLSFSFYPPLSLSLLICIYIYMSVSSLSFISNLFYSFLSSLSFNSIEADDMRLMYSISTFSFASLPFLLYLPFLFHSSSFSSISLVTIKRK